MPPTEQKRLIFLQISVDIVNAARYIITIKRNKENMRKVTDTETALIAACGIISLCFAAFVLGQEYGEQETLKWLRTEIKACQAEAMAIEEQNNQILPPPTEADWS